jgi:hypothetical protein
MGGRQLAPDRSPALPLRRASADSTAPSRRPHSLTTTRSRPSVESTVSSTTAPTGTCAARRACMPGRASRVSRSAETRRSASSATWAAGSSTWLTGTRLTSSDGGGGRWSVRAKRASARTVPPLAITRVTGAGWSATSCATAAARSRVTAATRRLPSSPSTSPVPSSPRKRPVPSATLVTPNTDVASQMPASRLPPPRSSPRTGWRPTHTPARWPTRQRCASSSPLKRTTGAPSTVAKRSSRAGPLAASRRAAVAMATTTSAPAPSAARCSRRNVRTAAAPRSGAIEPLRATSAPRWRSDRRRATGARVPSRQASTTSRWNDVLPRSKTATRTVGSLSGGGVGGRMPSREVTVVTLPGPVGHCEDSGPVSRMAE